MDGAHPNGAKVWKDTFRSRVPDFGDAALIAELRKQHVVIEVDPPSQWTSLFSRMPWPMLLVLGAAMLAGAVRLLRGGKAHPGSAASALPAHGMMGLVSRLFEKQEQGAKPPAGDSDEAKNR